MCIRDRVTAIRTEKDQEKVLKFVRSQLEEGRQVYVVSPLIDLSLIHI